MSNYWSHNLNHSPKNGYEKRQQSRYVSELGNNPTAEIPDGSMNRRARRLAARALNEGGEASAETRLGNIDLPIVNKRAEIIDAIRDNPVTIIVSETGSGKSTQVIQYVMDDLGRDGTVTQPRRIAARNIAQRVQEEVQQKRADLYGTIAIHTAEKDTRTDRTRATICTDGLRYVKQLHDTGELLDDILIIDEVHEWNTNIEMLVAWTRELIKDNPHMRVVLMSATVNAREIADFYSDVTEKTPPIIEVEGRTFPVDKREVADSTIVDVVLNEEMVGKNILCFLPGKGEIKDSIDIVKSELKKQQRSDVPELIPLHSKLSEHEQDKAFRQYEHGKIVFSTDVAQTSLTIPDIDVVVDSGVVRQKQIDEKGVESLPLVPISQDDCDQRAGRAGRVKSGEYVLTCLDRESEFIPYISRDKHAVPEILRTDVDRNVLHFASIGLDLENLKTLHHIKQETITRSKQALRLIGALDENGVITSLGRRMEQISMHPMYARMVVEAEQYSQTTQAQVIALAAASDVGGLKYYAPETSKRWMSLSEEAESDLLAQLDIFIASRDTSRHWQQAHDLDVKNVQRASEQCEKLMRRMQLSPDLLKNPNQQERENIKRCIYAGMVGHMYQHVGSGKYEHVVDQEGPLREISNRSVTRKSTPMLLAGMPYRYEGYEKGEKIDKHIIESVTKVSSPEVLASIALDLCKWKPEGRTLRAGRLMDMQTLELGGVSLGVSREVQAEPDGEAKQYLVRHIMEHPGAALRDVYAVEARIKELRKLSPHAPKSIHVEIRSIVEQAVEEGGLDESYIDYLIRAKDIKLSNYITNEHIEAIERSSPTSISRHGWDFSLSYEAGVPLIKRYDLASAALLPDEVVLDDGRVAKFVGEHGKRFTVKQLKSQR